MEITRIYLVENCYGDPNKVYIGKEKSHQKISRKNAHKRTYGQQINFSYIDEVESWEKINWKLLECYWIEQFRQWGFDIINTNKKGGQGPEFRTQEVKNKIGNSNRGKIKPKNQRWKDSFKKPILQYDLDGNFIKEWGSATDASKILKISKTGICSNLKRRLKTCSNYVWKYKNPNEIIKNINPINKSILQYDLNNNLIKEWKNILEIKNFYKKEIPGINAVLKQIKTKTNNKIYFQKSAYGYIWKYKS